MTTIIQATNDSYGKYTGQCKWFNDQLGYGFVTIIDGDEKGSDIFVHHSGVSPLNSQYKTLCKGEYINFNTIQGANGLQAVDITGIKGGPLMCDINVFPFRPFSKKPGGGGGAGEDEAQAQDSTNQGRDFSKIAEKAFTKVIGRNAGSKGKGKGGKGAGGKGAARGGADKAPKSFNKEN